MMFGSDDETSLKTHVIYAAFFVAAMQGIGFMKSWFFNMNNHTVVLRELKRLEYRLLARE